jgi:quinol monooxygenase YgiN
MHTMVIERVDFGIVAGREVDFELAMQRGCALLKAAAGCTAVVLMRGVERPTRYMLQITWLAIADHEAFVKTPDIQEFRSILGPFMGEKPAMEHFQQV